jgi:hypothetical protein
VVQGRATPFNLDPAASNFETGPMASSKPSSSSGKRKAQWPDVVSSLLISTQCTH